LRKKWEKNKKAPFKGRKQEIISARGEREVRGQPPGKKRYLFPIFEKKSLKVFTAENIRIRWLLVVS